MYFSMRPAHDSYILQLVCACSHDMRLPNVYGVWRARALRSPDEPATDFDKHDRTLALVRERIVIADRLLIKATMDGCPAQLVCGRFHDVRDLVKFSMRQRDMLEEHIFFDTDAEATDCASQQEGSQSSPTMDGVVLADGCTQACVLARAHDSSKRGALCDDSEPSKRLCCNL